MKALVYDGPGRRKLADRPKPSVKLPTDAVLRMSRTTLCGTDLHILNGDVPSCRPGTVLGHEGVGVVDTAGSSVSSFKRGDRVLISCISACGHCTACRKGMYSHCATGGWMLGNTIDGTQAEYVRIPHADTSLYLLPPDCDEEAMVMLSDILPTGYECGVRNGRVGVGSTVAIVGAGPVGLAALLTASLHCPAQIIVVDVDDNRLGVAQRFGASAMVNSSDDGAAARIMDLTGGRGVDTAIEAVGIPATFALCQDIVGAGGTIANVGVHGAKVDLHLERLWSHNVTITTGLVDTGSIPLLLRTVESKRIDAHQFVTHRFTLEDIDKAYATFATAATTKALKVMIET